MHAKLHYNSRLAYQHVLLLFWYMFHKNVDYTNFFFVIIRVNYRKLLGDIAH